MLFIFNFGLGAAQHLQNYFSCEGNLLFALRRAVFALCHSLHLSSDIFSFQPRLIHLSSLWFIFRTRAGLPFEPCSCGKIIVCYPTMPTTGQLWFANSFAVDHWVLCLQPQWREWLVPCMPKPAHWKVGTWHQNFRVRVGARRNVPFMKDSESEAVLVGAGVGRHVQFMLESESNNRNSCMIIFLFL